MLKGDVLGYLGRISSSYASEQSKRITKLEHLDLSNVKAAPSKEMGLSPPSKAQAQKAPEPKLELADTEIAIPISLSSVISVQTRIQATLGITLPLSTFITRATTLANDDLPRSAASRPYADELFNDILGLDKVNTKVQRGRYLPQITALPAKSPMERARVHRQQDVYDILTDRSTKITFMNGTKALTPGIMGDSSESTNVFSVSAARGDEKRARVFLERVKTILQVEPGRLIL